MKTKFLNQKRHEHDSKYMKRDIVVTFTIR